MKNVQIIAICLAFLSVTCSQKSIAPTATTKQMRPNIVFILADDLGYGDVKSLNPDGKIATPHIDKLAAEGMIFTDAHTSSSVCTPSRYSLLTGRYAWRTHLQTFVLNGFSPPLIDSNRMTVAAFLKQQGYNTACVGKWHLGMNLPIAAGTKLPDTDAEARFVNVDWKGTIKNSPVSKGFDYFFGVSASGDMPPYVYVENDKFVGECTVEKKFGRVGQAQKDFESIDIVPDCSRKTVEFIKKQNAQTPFFAYVPLASPHTPILPTKEWQGKSNLNKYADYVMQTDAVVGQIMAAIDEMGLADNTIIIFSSDNGCSPEAGIGQLAKNGHRVSANYRGSKADLWEGGHRVPFIVRWQNKIKANTKSNATICLTDFFATLSDLTGKPIPDGNAEDSQSFLPAFFGKPINLERKGIIHHSISGHFAYRQGKWKLLLARGSGGWTSPKEKEATNAPVAQLYDMENDPSEQVNLYEKNPEVTKMLLQQLETDVKTGRSTKGKASKNDVAEIVLWKTR
jgi:arylsulfatase A